MQRKDNNSMKVKKLSEEQIAAAANCKTIEEKLDFLSKNKLPLPDEMLDKISGGKEADDFNYCKTCGIWFDHWWEALNHYYKKHL